MSSARPELRRLLGVLALLIVYVSLYPFRFRVMPVPIEPAWSPVDMVANVLLFLPFGLLVRWMAGGPQRHAKAAGAGLGNFREPRVVRNRLTLLLLAGAALAAVLQWLQVLVPGRQPSLMDVAMNWIGLGAGAAAAPWLSPHRWQRFGRFWLDSRAGLLVLCWLAAQLSPYLPTHPMRAIARQLYAWQQLPWQLPTLLAHSLAWLLVLRLLWRRVGWQPIAALLAVALLPQTWLLGNTLTRDEWLAPLLAVAVFAAGFRSLKLLLLLSLLLLAWRGLAPWHWLTLPLPFHWLPFGGLVAAPVPFALATLAEKAFWYGSLYELGVRVGWRQRPWLLVLLGLLLAIEIAQCWLPGHRAELTDLIVLLLMVLLLRTVASESDRDNALPTGSA